MNRKPLVKFFVFCLALQLVIGQGYGQDKRRMVIVTFGNSTTAPRKTIDKVYAVRIHEILSAAGTDNTVINAGIPGSHTGSIRDNSLFKIAHGRDRFDTAVLQHRPDWTTINFGINDSWQDAGKKGTSRVPIDKYRENLSFFIDQIEKQHGHVILLTPNPVGKKYKGFHYRRLQNYMKVTRKLAREKQVRFLDTWKLFYGYVRGKSGGLDMLLLDGVHPNDLGHQLIAEAIARIIRSPSK